MDDKEFNLHKNYHDAIERIQQYERVIKNLKEQLMSKDVHIATLEDKIVQMSFELASSKSLEDEHQLFKRRMSSQSNMSHMSSSVEQSRTPQTNEEQDEGQQNIIVDFAPSLMDNTRRSRNNLRIGFKPTRPNALSSSFGAAAAGAKTAKPNTLLSLSQSWCAISAQTQGSSEVVPANVVNSAILRSPRIPRAIDTTGGHYDSGAVEPTRRQARGFSLSRAMSWVSEDTPLDDGMDDSAKYLNGASNTFARDGNYQSSPAISIMIAKTKMRQVSVEEFQAKRPRNTRAGKAQSSLSLREPPVSASGRFSNIGHLLGLKKNGNSEFGTVEEIREKMVCAPGLPRRDSDSASSSRSCISGVVFPVSSADCLEGCGNDFESRRHRAFSTANEEWPTFK